MNYSAESLVCGYVFGGLGRGPDPARSTRIYRDYVASPSR